MNLTPSRIFVSLAQAAITTAIFLAPRVASAQDANGNCPPGSWFCADAPPPAAPPALPPPDAQPAQPAQPAPPPPVVVYQPPPPVVVVPRDPPKTYEYHPRPRIPHREWGLNLHLGGIIIGGRQNSDVGMGLVGLGLRFRPAPSLALDLNVDVAGGKDYNGLRRTETMGTVNALLFLNPRSRAQLYLLGGLGISGARVSSDSQLGLYTGDTRYMYVGGQGGIGLEVRVSRVVALNFDVRGFVRTRTDSGRTPEFIDSTGRTTNTSGGGLLTGGITFYF